jgi:hypothetical protein
METQHFTIGGIVMSERKIHKIDIEKFREANKAETDTTLLHMKLLDKAYDHWPFNEAFRLGWVPNFLKATEVWYMDGAKDPNVGLAYVDHILEEHPQDEIIDHIEELLKSQAKEFLEALKESLGELEEVLGEELYAKTWEELKETLLTYLPKIPPERIRRYIDTVNEIHGSVESFLSFVPTLGQTVVNLQKFEEN